MATQELTPKQAEYADKLKDPRWQIRRLRTFERDGFACMICGAKDKELQVHHIKYEYGLDPWDYLDQYLVTLCKDCHKTEGMHRKEIEVVFLFKLFHAHFGCAELVVMGQCLGDRGFVAALRELVVECRKRDY